MHRHDPTDGATPLSALATGLGQLPADAIAAEVANMARRHPLLFLGGAALAGFAAMRLKRAAETEA